ncbi:hypothetical protein [Paracoccus sp. SJTW-4]|uniref:hypothetical protein n=1 Tax=Paracoccus sp. SJTW-4 TaxID=3078428 RepID=UPI0039EB5FC2
MMNRAQRRILSSNADKTAAKMAAATYDFQSGGLVRVTDRRAIGALQRGFAAMLRARGEPQAIAITPEEAEGFPHHRGHVLPGGVTWLAVGLDAGYRATYALQSARDDAGDSKRANETARSLALLRLASLAATGGFPIGETRGTA